MPAKSEKKIHLIDFRELQRLGHLAVVSKKRKAVDRETRIRDMRLQLASRGVYPEWHPTPMCTHSCVSYGRKCSVTSRPPGRLCEPAVACLASAFFGGTEDE